MATLDAIVAGILHDQDSVDARRSGAIAVLGAGTMGHGIAHAAMAGGYETRMYDVSAAGAREGARAIDGIVAKGVELGKVRRPTRTRMLRG